MLALTEQSCRRPGLLLTIVGLTSLVFILLVALPSLWPNNFPYLSPLQVDTDPENMLSADEPVRLLHNQMKKTYSLSDMVVVGVINQSHENGVFNQQSLSDIYTLSKFAETLQWPSENGPEGVLGIDIISPSSVDNIEQTGLGSVKFEWLMPEPPKSDAEAAAIAEKASRIPFLQDTLLSSDHKAVALYIPISAKNLSYKVSRQLREKIASFKPSDDAYYITGMPVAQDQFGVEMFQQMAISAPMAMLLIFLLMWLFFKNLQLVVSPMLVALASVIITMGLMIATGHTVHIMTSMIPIFIMPIAVLDAVHILSDFFDRYPRNRDRYQTMKAVMEELSKPMMYTSLTTGVAFASLALTPIPPVRVFGLFVGIGVIVAWLLTITLIPAYIMLMPERAFANFGMKHPDEQSDNHPSLVARLMQWIGQFSYNHAKLIVVVTVMLGGAAYYGISQIVINDNPVKWFAPDHELRVADKVLNERFAGTYMAYLSLQASDEPALSSANRATQLSAQLKGLKPNIAAALQSYSANLVKVDTATEFEQLLDYALQQQEAAVSDADWYAWGDAVDRLEQQLARREVFKSPEVLQYIEQLQASLLATGLVGKSNALTDIIKTVHRELLLGDASAFRIPDSQAAVAQTLITYESSHRPQDLWHFVSPDFRRTNLWIQLKSGDNKDMNSLIKAVEQFFNDNPPPRAISHDWFGLTYINVVWQDKMVRGMFSAFVGSFVVVLIMMVFLFRSLWWGLLCMVPLTVTIAVTYGFIGLIGKSYDMPIAILSSLSLGLAVDYAIHFLARSRELRANTASWQQALPAVFGEPARAISRNIIVIGCGFLPLLAAPLVPYQTVGLFISSILVLAGVESLFLLPALISLFEKTLFKPTATTAKEPSND